MKGFAAGAVLAAMAHTYELKAYEAKSESYLLNDQLYLSGYLKWDWSAGYRTPMRWAKYESWHEPLSWSYEIYTASKLKFPLTLTMYDSTGADTLFSMTWTPYVLLWDFTPLEIMTMWWPEGNEEKLSQTNDTCIYTGWFYKLWQPKIDLSYSF